MKGEEYTQEQMGEKVGWKREVVAMYVRLNDKIVAQVLDKAKLHQRGRATKDVADATHNFTEGWFRNSRTIRY